MICESIGKCSYFSLYLFIASKLKRFFCSLLIITLILETITFFLVHRRELKISYLKLNQHDLSKKRSPIRTLSILILFLINLI